MSYFVQNFTAIFLSLYGRSYLSVFSRLQCSIYCKSKCNGQIYSTFNRYVHGQLEVLIITYLYWLVYISMIALQWRHKGCDSVSNHQPHDCLLNGLFKRRSKKTSKPRVTGLCVGNSPVPGEFPAQMASNAENVSISWRHHVSPPVLTHWPMEPSHYRCQ